ncbi:hypothetical protein BJF78_17840 [Pseudonocardia sp. CNS-139]|nr:hypothetical protein BJF78_17840 [Pseudonocardia sp. CNS-139]
MLPDRARLAGPGVDADDAARAVSWVAPAFELNEARIDGPQDPGIRVADNLTQWGLVVGPQVTPLPDRSLLQKTVATLRHGDEVVEVVEADGYIDDYYLSIARLAHELAKFDLAVEEGDLVITGSLASRRKDLAPGDYTGAFSGIGEVNVTFA